MNTRLLKSKEMNKFCKWVAITNPQNPWTMAEFERSNQASKKFNFFHDRAKTNYKLISDNSHSCITMLDMYSFGHKMKDYIKKRQGRKIIKKEKKMKNTIRNKNGKRTVGMYPINCREINFRFSNKYQNKYIWPQEDFLSPSRIFNGTNDKSFLEKWRQRVGNDEADRIIEESKSIGTSMHQYLENSILKFADVKYQNHPPIVNPSYHAHVDIAYKLGAVILEQGLKNRLDEVWGLEAHVYYDIFYRGIVDCVGIYEGEPAIIDFKQKRSMPKKEWIEDYFMQVAAYGMSHNYMFNTNIKKGVVLVVDRKTEFKRFIIEGKEWNHYCNQFCNKLKEFIQIDHDRKEESLQAAKNRLDKINTLQKEL